MAIGKVIVSVEHGPCVIDGANACWQPKEAEDRDSAGAGKRPRNVVVETGVERLRRGEWVSQVGSTFCSRLIDPEVWLSGRGGAAGSSATSYSNITL
jgi:hypothetical protein